MTRRDALRYGGAGLAALMTPTLLSACGSSGGAVHGGGGGTPRRGGIAEVSVTDSSTTDRLNPTIPLNTHDIVAQSLIFDPLVRVDRDFRASPALAASWDHNADATVWEFVLRDGVTWHDDSPFGAGDVVWSLRKAVDPKGQGTGATIYGSVLAPEGITAVGRRRVRFKLKRPNFFLPQFLATFYTLIAKEGTTDFRKPVGTGPFVVESFNPGNLFTCKRNPHYWESGMPYLDGVRLVAVPDQATKVQTVLSGTAHLGDAMEYKFVKQVESGGDTAVLSAPGGHFTLIVGQHDKAPFGDGRVMRALQHLVDREKMVEQVYFGKAQVSAEVAMPPSDPFYPHGIAPRAHDPELARSLLKQAGQDSLKLEIWTSQFFPGVVDMPVAFKQMAADAGVEVDVRVVQPQTYISTIITQRPSFIDPWLRQHALVLPPLLYTPGGPFNETHTNVPQIPQLLNEAAAVPDLAAQKQKIADACQLIQDNATQIEPCAGDFAWPRKQALQGLDVSWQSLVTLRTAYLA